MVLKFVSMPPSQRSVTWNWPQRAASSTTICLACFFVPTNSTCPPPRTTFWIAALRLLDALERLLQVDDVDAVALHEDELLHLRVPAPRLMPEVDTRFEQVLHRDIGHVILLRGCASAPRVRMRAARGSRDPGGTPARRAGRVGVDVAGLALAELEPLARARLSVLLALLHARIAREEALAAERAPQRSSWRTSARAIAMRMAPAWPVSPPPVTRAITSYLSGRVRRRERVRAR